MKFKLCLLGCQTLTIELPHHGCIFHYVGACKRKKIVLKKKSNYEKEKKNKLCILAYSSIIFSMWVFCFAIIQLK